MNIINRHKTRIVQIGNVQIGGCNTIAVQSMTNTDTSNVSATVAQVEELAQAGCDIVRVAVPNTAAANSLKEIIDYVSVPIVADIHFDYRLALKALDAGVSKLRINPGNIGENVVEVAKAAKYNGVPIRIGVNAGSLDQVWLDQVRQGKISLGVAMAKSALQEAQILDDHGFEQIVLSVKASDLNATLVANRILADACDFPLHVGMTEAGTARNATIKSSAGIGALLLGGLGDTIRVSITGPPPEEVIVGRKLLQALDMRKYGPEIISCPTCGRTKVDVVGIVDELERRILADEDLRQSDCKVAIMGCVVNGPGEAAAADVGFAGGFKEGLIFAKGQMLAKVSAANAVEHLVEQIRKIGNN